MSSMHRDPSRTKKSTTHHAWRVILVGRTGLDQLLRRDASIELVRARDTIDAIGELSDPIDSNSPSQAIVLVASSCEPGRDELAEFLDGLRLIDPKVRAMRVGTSSAMSELYDGVIDPDANLAQIIDAIEKTVPSTRDVTLRFVDHQESKSEATQQVADEVAPIIQASAVEAPIVDTTPEPEPEPEVVVVVQNESFTHRAQRDFEDEPEIHQQVVMGAHDAQESRTLLVPHNAAPVSVHNTVADGFDDQPLVEAMLAGRSILNAAIARINARLRRHDITLSDDLDAIGIPIVVGTKALGSLVCADHAWAMGHGHEAMCQQARWLSGWVKLEVQQSELRTAAFTDSLTGAWNRRYFSRFLDAAIIQARDARVPLTVMLFDIDGFKHYNDTYGHAAGDEILSETVKLLKSVIRPSDRVCRVGGDEFVVIFYEPSGPRDPSSKPLESVYQIATRFQQQICTHRFPKLAGEAQGTLTVSGGLASFPWDGHDADSLLEKADQLAIESKKQGKNAITLGPGAQSVCKNPKGC